MDKCRKLGFDELLEAERKRGLGRQGRRLMAEHQLQSACVRWFELAYSRLKGRLFAVPNGGWRSRAGGGMLKAEGVRRGVADLILLKPSGGYGALLIEMKTAEGRQSAEQREWEREVTRDDEYKYVICRSLEGFMAAVEEYLCALD